MFINRNILILGIVGFSSLILILVSTIDTSFAVDIQSTSINNAEFENEVIKNNNSPNEDENICLRYENITKTIIVCNGKVDIPTIYDFINNNSEILEMKEEKELLFPYSVYTLD